MSNFRLIFIILVVILVAMLVARLFKPFKQQSIDGDIRLIDTDDNALEDAALSTEPAEDGIGNHFEEYTLPPGLDVVGLLHWYHDRAIKHKRSLKGAFNCFYLYFGLVFFAWLLVDSRKLSPVASYSLLIPSVLILIYYIISRRKRIANIFNSNCYVELNEKQFPKIWSACYQIMQRAQLSHKLRIYYVKSDKAEASVAFEQGTIYLLLSRGMITYSQKNFKDVESIIGHEMGHVCQGDTTVMLIGKRVIQLPIIIMGFSFILLVSFPSNEFFRFQVNMGTNVFLWFFCWLFVIQRREAEYLADMASLIFVNNSTISELVERHLPRSGNLNYPSRRRRLAFIRKTVAKYNKYKQPFPDVHPQVIDHSVT